MRLGRIRHIVVVVEDEDSLGRVLADVVASVGGLSRALDRDRAKAQASGC